MEGIQESLFGRTFPEHSAATREMISLQSYKPSSKWSNQMFMSLDLRTANGRTPDASWLTAAPSLGVSMTLNTGESPSVVKESTLSQILEANAPEKYYLSPRACAGILRRAEKRGKELPKMLKEALEEVIYLHSLNEQDAPEEEKESSSEMGGGYPLSKHCDE